jgi:hypothetical protein
MVDRIEPIQTLIKMAMYGLYKERIKKIHFFKIFWSKRFLVQKIHCSNLFSVFVKISFLCKAPIYVTYNPLLISSNRDEFFTTNTLKYPLEIKPAVLISHSPIRIYRILKVKNLFLAKTMLY